MGQDCIELDARTSLLSGLHSPARFHIGDRTYCVFSGKRQNTLIERHAGVVNRYQPPLTGQGMAEPEDLLRRWLKRARESSFAHYAAENWLNKLHLTLGIPATIFAAVVGTAVFASLENSVTLWAKIAVGLFSIATAILSGLQTFLRFSEKAERHRRLMHEHPVRLNVVYKTGT